MSFLSLRRSHIWVFHLTILGAWITLSSIEPLSQEVPFFLQRKVIDWKLTHRNTAVPPANLRYVVSDLSGAWDHHISHRIGTRVTFAPIQPGKYRAHFSTSTGSCTRHGDSDRIATYRDGILYLDHPVKEYSQGPYNRLFTIRTPEGIRLISDTAFFSPRKQDVPVSDNRVAFMRREEWEARRHSR